MNVSKRRRSVAVGNKSDWQNLKDIDRNLLLAFEARHFDRVDQLIRSGANVNVRFGNIKDSALHFFDSIEIVTKLIECGINASASNRFHESALTYACQFGRHRDIIKILLKNGAYVNKQTKHGQVKTIPIMLALDKSNKVIDMEVIEELLYYGANVDFGKMFSDTPFISALNGSSPELARLMIKYSVLKIWDKYRFLRMGIVERRYLVVMNAEKHLPYFEECVSEIDRMKVEMFNSWHSLYDICRGCIYFNTYTGPYVSFLKSFNTRAFADAFPIYSGVLRRRVEFIQNKRSKLFKNLDDIKFSSKFAKSEKGCKRLVALNVDCLRHVAQYLCNSDIERLVRSSSVMEQQKDSLQ